VEFVAKVEQRVRLVGFRRGEAGQGGGAEVCIPLMRLTCQCPQPLDLGC
jgi:hypothetical protein